MDTRKAWAYRAGAHNFCSSWWRHQMEKFSELLAFWAKASDAELWCFLWSAPEPTVEQTMETLEIWDATTLIVTAFRCKTYFGQHNSYTRLTQLGISSRGHYWNCYPGVLYVKSLQLVWRKVISYTECRSSNESHRLNCMMGCQDVSHSTALSR